jgi:TMEM175 potassium channel family protein
MAVSKLAPQPVAFYAAVFFLVKATCVALISELIDEKAAIEIGPKAHRFMRVRSIMTLLLFGAAALAALRLPVSALAFASVA